MVVAPPGCGKTELLAFRAEYMLARLEPNQRVLALTFTNRAQANLKERLRGVLGAARMRRFVAVHNFHGHATQVILAHGRTIGLEVGALALPTTKTLSKALNAVEGDPTVRRDAEALLAEVKRSARTDAEVLEALHDAHGRPGRDAALQVETERQQANCLHYDDLLRHAQRLLSVPAVARLYQRHFGAVLVDEFQDLSLQQLDLVARSCAASRTFAGDPLQGIYSWAGADPIGVEKILRPACGEPVSLTTSYRSAPAVLAMVNSLGTTLGAPALSAVEPDRWHEGGFGSAVVLRDRNHEADVIVRLSQMILERDPGSTIGVITRSGWRRTVIDSAFAAAPAVPVRRWDLAVDDPRVLELIRAGLATLPRSVGFDDAKEAIVAALDPADVDTIEQVHDAFEQLAAGSAKTVRGALARLRASDPDEAVSPGVHLLNAHTGKGQQFDWVFVVGLEEKHVPDRRNSEGDALAEEFRVLLVMVSRARHGLVATTVQTLDGMYGPYPAKTSRWFPPLVESSQSELRLVEGHLAAIPFN